MTDEELKKEKYLCAMQSGTEGLAIADLFVRNADGTIMKVMTLQKGQYLLTELVDFGDLKKSRLVGSLSKCIDRGWIVVEDPAEEIKVSEPEVVEVKTVTPSQALTEVKAGIIDKKDVTDPVADVVNPTAKGIDPFPKEVQPKVVEIVSKKESKTPNSFAITETDATVGKVKSEGKYAEFDSLRYFQKLKAIKETQDVELLDLVSKKSNYPQLVHNSQSRLKELRESK